MLCGELTKLFQLHATTKCCRTLIVYQDSARRGIAICVFFSMKFRLHFQGFFSGPASFRIQTVGVVFCGVATISSTSEAAGAITRVFVAVVLSEPFFLDILMCYSLF